MNGAHYGRDPWERQERREAVREAMVAESMMVENPESIYSRRPSRYEMPRAEVRDPRLDEDLYQPAIINRSVVVDDYPNPNHNSALRKKQRSARKQS